MYYNIKKRNDILSSDQPIKLFGHAIVTKRTGRWHMFSVYRYTCHAFHVRHVGQWLNFRPVQILCSLDILPSIYQNLSTARRYRHLHLRPSSSDSSRAPKLLFELEHHFTVIMTRPPIDKRAYKEWWWQQRWSKCAREHDKLWRWIKPSSYII